VSKEYSSRYLRTYGEIGVCVSLDILFNVIIRWKIRRIATNVDTLRILIYPNPIHEHMYWEHEICKVDLSKVLGHAKICNDVLVRLRKKDGTNKTHVPWVLWAQALR